MKEYKKPRKELITSELFSALSSEEFKNSNKSTVIVGEKEGAACLVDIEKSPHLLVAGATGSGKSVLMHNIIISLLMKNTPKDAQLVIIDPKRVELSFYKNSTMLWKPIAKETEEIKLVLSALIEEMENRYKEMEEKSIRKWTGKKLYVFIDEFADLVMTSDKSTYKYIVRLAQLARAAGIHLIIATQSPRREVITGMLKNNIPTRICLKVKSGIDSRIVLDHEGAEKIELYHGILSSSLEEEEFKSYYVSDKEIERVASATIQPLSIEPDRSLKPGERLITSSRDFQEYEENPLSIPKAVLEEQGCKYVIKERFYNTIPSTTTLSASKNKKNLRSFFRWLFEE